MPAMPIGPLIRKSSRQFEEGRHVARQQRAANEGKGGKDRDEGQCANEILLGYRVQQDHAADRKHHGGPRPLQEPCRDKHAEVWVQSLKSSDPIANTAIDAVKMRRGPNRSDSQLLRGTRAAIARKYDVRATFAWTGSTPRSRAISGSGVAISVLSSDFDCEGRGDQQRQQAAMRGHYRSLQAWGLMA